MRSVIPFNRFREYDIANYDPYPSFMPQAESPETAIARQSPDTAAEVLKDFSKKVLYKNLAESAGSVANTYLNCLREVDSPNLRQSSQLDVGVKMIANEGMRRLIFGEEERGFIISMRLR